MKDVQLIVDLAAPPAALLERYPSLRNLGSRQVKIVEDFLRRQREAGGPNPAAAKFTEAQYREALEFYNLVVSDGRYISLLQSDPDAAAAHLNKKISAETREILAYAKHFDPGGPIEDGGDVAIAIIGGILVGTTAGIIGAVFLKPVEGGAAARAGEPTLIMLDHSGQIKL